MDHVLESLREWLRIYDEPDNTGWKDENAINCIKKAIKELEEYYAYED